MSYYVVYYHIVFRTHRSAPSINEQSERELYKYVYAYCREHGVKLWRINSMPDHVHLFLTIPPSKAVAEFVRELKITTGNFMKSHREQFPLWDGWGTGYCCLSYGKDAVPDVIAYIMNQKEHHRTRTFAQEIEELFDRYGIEKGEFFERDWGK